MKKPLSFDLVSKRRVKLEEIFCMKDDLEMAIYDRDKAYKIFLEEGSTESIGWELSLKKWQFANRLHKQGFLVANLNGGCGFCFLFLNCMLCPVNELFRKIDHNCMTRDIEKNYQGIKALVERLRKENGN